MAASQREKVRELQGRAARYEVRMNMRFAILRAGKIPVRGRGWSSNVSRTGMLFTTTMRMVEVGDLIVAAVDWPVPSIDGQALYLVLSGRVARVRRPEVAIQIRTHRLWRASELDERYELWLGPAVASEVSDAAH